MYLFYKVSDGYEILFSLAEKILGYWFGWKPEKKFSGFLLYRIFERCGIFASHDGDVAQLARALDWQSRGRGTIHHSPSASYRYLDSSLS